MNTLAGPFVSFIAAFGLIVGFTDAARGQEPAPDFADIQSRVRQGDVLHVTDTTGRAFRWTIADLPVEQLIRQPGLSQSDVREVAVERHDSLWNGALIGLAAAGVPWLIVCAANDWCYYNEYGAENMLRHTALATAAIGAGIGALIDRFIRERVTIYRAPGPQPLSIDVSPGVSPAGAGIRVSLSF